MENAEVAKVLRETAQLLAIDGGDIGRYRSYEKAADLLDGLHERIEDLAKDEEKLLELPGVGEGIASHIHEILRTGDYSLRHSLLKKYPATILQLLELQSLGPKKVALLWKKFHVASVPELEKLAREHKLLKMRGFGEKSELNILKAAQQYKHLCGTGRFHINFADDEARDLIAYVAKARTVESVVPAGSLRRGKETIGDLDLLATMRPDSDKQKDIDSAAEYVLNYERIKEKLVHGENKLSVLLNSGLQVDVRLLRKENFGAALLYFTGSKEHNVALRARAGEMGWTLNEYALTSLKSGKIIASKSEEEI